MTRKQYSQPSVSAGSTFTDLANPGSQNILGGKKIQKVQKNTKPEFATHQQPFTWHFRCNCNGNSSRDDLQYTEGCAQVMCKYYTILHRVFKHPWSLFLSVGGRELEPISPRKTMCSYMIHIPPQIVKSTQINRDQLHFLHIT